MNLDYRVVIPSRHREELILDRSINLVPSATVVVYEEEEENYEKTLPDETTLITHPIEKGLAKIRQWCLDNFDEEGIIFMDDDVKNVRCLVGTIVRRYTDEGIVRKVFENGLICAKDLDISLCYWNRASRPQWFDSGNPFRLSKGYAGTVFGVRGRELEFDTDLIMRVDVDLTLKAHLKDRIVWKDNRFFFFSGGIWEEDGGNQGVRTSKNVKENDEKLKEKWGKYIEMDKETDYENGALGTSINVDRKQ